jgi:uncharacterized protein YeaO (DUF488 family)
MIILKRVYDYRHETQRGFTILVDRLWPRGVSKKEVHISLWLKDIAPSTELRTWFAHDPKKWREFKARYKKELHHNKELVHEIIDAIKKHKNIIFLYAAKDEKHNNAIVLKEYLARKV